MNELIDYPPGDVAELEPVDLDETDEAPTGAPPDDLDDQHAGADDDSDGVS